MILVTRPNYLTNPDNFQVLAVGKKTYEKRPTINIQNFELTCEDSVTIVIIIHKAKSSFLHFFYLFGIFLRTKMPGQRAKVKMTKNKSMENCKFVSSFGGGEENL
jgi:hypothetical protein